MLQVAVELLTERFEGLVLLVAGCRGAGQVVVVPVLVDLGDQRRPADREVGGTQDREYLQQALDPGLHARGRVVHEGLSIRRGHVDCSIDGADVVLRIVRGRRHPAKTTRGAP